MGDDMAEATSLENKRFLVTGAAQGLGETIAARIVDLGGRVIIDDVQDEAGAATADRLGPAASFQHLDVTSEEDWDAAVAVADDALGGLDGLVNNAAILHMGLLEEMAVAHARTLIDINLMGPLIGTRAVAPALRANGGGSIVNISSIGGLEGMNSTVAYNCSKWGVRGLTRAAALELGRDAIRVNAVCPGMGNPDMSTPFLDQFDLDRYLQTAPRIAFHERGRPRNVDVHDVAEMVVWLLSDAARGCTGADFAVDAGWTAGTYAEGLPGF
jgi:3alpha(or 20beta)-hydroxysteroid dehydrogenase